MDNTRKLSGTDVPETATNSVKSMIEDLANALVRDFKLGLERNNQTISESDLNVLRDYIVSNVGITMSITLKVDTKLVNGLNISVLPVNQSGLEGFNKGV